MVVAVPIAGADVSGGGCCSLSINKCAVDVAHSAALGASRSRCPDALLMAQSAVTAVLGTTGHRVGTVLTTGGDLAQILPGGLVPLFLVSDLLSCSSCCSGQNRFHLAYAAAGSSEAIFTISGLEVTLNSLAGFCQLRVGVSCICLLSLQTEFYLD